MLETLEKVDPAFRADVLNGLSEPIPAIPARWLYDRRGSELFDEITRLPAYYPTRIETALLKSRMSEIARLVAPSSAVVEFGAGSATKTPILLREVKPAAYVPVDISGDYLRESAEVVDDDFPDLAVHPVVADFTKPFDLPREIEGMGAATRTTSAVAAGNAIIWAAGAARICQNSRAIAANAGSATDRVRASRSRPSAPCFHARQIITPQPNRAVVGKAMAMVATRQPCR